MRWVGVCAIPPIPQKARNGWGTHGRAGLGNFFPKAGFDRVTGSNHPARPWVPHPFRVLCGMGGIAQTPNPPHSTQHRIGLPHPFRAFCGMGGIAQTPNPPHSTQHKKRVPHVPRIWGLGIPRPMPTLPQPPHSAHSVPPLHRLPGAPAGRAALATRGLPCPPPPGRRSPHRRCTAGPECPGRRRALR